MVTRPSFLFISLLKKNLRLLIPLDKIEKYFDPSPKLAVFCLKMAVVISFLPGYQIHNDQVASSEYFFHDGSIIE